MNTYETQMMPFIKWITRNSEDECCEWSIREERLAPLAVAVAADHHEEAHLIALVTIAVTETVTRLK